MLYPAGELQIHHCGLRVFGVRPRLGAHHRETHHARNATRVVNEHAVSRPHLFNRTHCLGIGHTVPDGFLVLFQIADGVGVRIGFREEVVHTRYLPTRCGPLRSFSLQMNSIKSVSGMMRWFTLTVKGLVYTEGSSK